MRRHVVQDLSHLPTYGFGPRMTTWWGTLSFCVLEGTGFALAVGAYLYLAFLNPDWPLSAAPPGLLWSGIFTALMLASLVPNQMAKRAAKREDIKRLRILLLVMSAVGVALTAIRVLEFGGLNVRWDQNAYGSLTWVLLGLHTLHVVTDVADTIVVTALMHTRHCEGKRFTDVEDNAFYWYFVAGSWLPIYLLLYWGPRL